MAPGLNGSQTGTVPKNKSRSSESQTHRLSQEPFIQSSLLEWEHMSEVGNKNYTKKKSCTSHPSTEVDSLQHELEVSRLSAMSSQKENVEGCSLDNFPGKVSIPDCKQVVNKLSQIQSYVQQTAALMSTLKASDSPNSESQYSKLSAMLEDLQDSERKLGALLNKMDTTESKVDSLLGDDPESQGSSNLEADEEELARRSKESKRKLEILQKRKQELLKLQDKAKKQLLEAQAEQSRLAARASSLNQELNASKVTDLNFQQLNQRLKVVQDIYNTRDQIAESLNDNHKSKNVKAKRSEEEQTEVSDTENDFQLVADKMEELDAMKAQLNQIQKIMSSITAMQHTGLPSNIASSGDCVKEQVNHNSQNSSFSEGDHIGEDGNNNLMKLEQAKSKLNHLTQLLEIVQSAQNANGLSPTYLQLVSNLVGEETNSCSGTPSPASSVKSSQRGGGEIAVQTMQVMTKELEETTAAMKEERDRLLAARQELQDIAKRLPLNKSEAESVSPEYDSESEPPCLKPATFDSNTRNSMNGLTESEKLSNCNDNNSYVVRSAQSRNRQRGKWDSTSPASNCTTQERRNKNESLSRGCNATSCGNSCSLGRNTSHTSPSPSISCYNERPSALTESQQQLEMSGNLCEIMLSESFPRNIRPSDVSLQEMFSQHQLLTRTVAQCSQLLWLQQKQIIELRNAIMFQCGSFPNQLQIAPNQSHLNMSSLGNPFLTGPSISNIRHIPSVSVQQHQNFLHPLHQNVKLNVRDMQNIQTSHQDFPEQCLPLDSQTMHFPDGFGCDLRSGNFSRFNSSSSNSNHNFHQNLSSGFNNRGLNGINSLIPEDSGALNNQVPPGNRANNYWDNFRSYSRQNLLSNTKSNEGTELYRGCLAVSSQDRPLRDSASSSVYNNQSAAGTSQQPAFLHGNCETASSDQCLLPPSQNTRASLHAQSSRSGSVESQSQRNPGKNESRHQDNESRNLNSSAKNEGMTSGRSRNPDSTSDIRSVRNDVAQGFRNTDNINTTRNFIQMVRDIDNEEIAHGNNKKRLERTRCRNEGLENLNNRSYQNTSLWDNIYAEVSNFIRANECRPHFLLQLFRDLQLVTTDNLRQRTLVAIQETGTANNLIERTSNMNGININVFENRNNIRENRSNLNRNLTEDLDRVDQLFYHLRENQNTIRQNIGMSSHVLGGNLENPNISNIRDLGNTRNNLENEGLRDLRTYFEANLCNFGHNSTLENPNLSNIRENLTRRVSGISDLDNVQPKNVFLSIYDNTAEPRRHNQESSSGPDFGSPYRNYHLGNDFVGNEVSENCENIQTRNTDFEEENNVEDVVGGRAQFEQENRPTSSRYSLVDGGENFGRSRQYLGNGNDSGIDINFNNEQRKRMFAEGDTNGNDVSVKASKEDINGAEGSAGFIVQTEWERNGSRDVSFESSLNSTRKNSSFAPICDNTFFHCRTFQQSDNGDLAEADQSRNEETSGAESDSGFINAQILDSDLRFSPDGNLQFSENNFSSQTIPESERNFMETKSCENGCNIDGSCAGGSEGGNPNFKGNQERNTLKMNDCGDGLRKNETSDNYFYQLHASPSSESAPVQKSGVKHRKRIEENNDGESVVDIKKSSCKNSTNKFRDSSFSQGKCNGTDDFDIRKTEMDSLGSTLDSRPQPESRDPLFYGAFQLALEKSVEAEKGNTSPEAESDWECGSGLDQVPTRLNKRGSSRKSEDSNGSGS